MSAIAPALTETPLLEGMTDPVRAVSLGDQGDNDPVRFWTYLIAAIQTIHQEVGVDARQIVSAPQLRSIEPVAISLINDISQLPHDLIVVLDDYHAVDSKQIDSALTYLIEKMPPQMHLVIATREDPSLPLSRLRARGQLTELRATDLQFTPAEAAEFLNQVMGLNISTEDIAALEARTEGWIAGLQLAALSMQGRPDAAGASARPIAACSRPTRPTASNSARTSRRCATRSARG